MILQNCTDVTLTLNEVSDMRKQDILQIEKNKKGHNCLVCQKLWISYNR